MLSPDIHLLSLIIGERRRQLLQGLTQTLPATLPFLYKVSDNHCLNSMTTGFSVALSGRVQNVLVQAANYCSFHKF